MKFNLIDKETWSRKPYFDHFLNNVRCTYSMTANIDITVLLIKLKNNNIKLYPVLIYMATKIINRHEEFRTCFDESGNLGYWENMNPCFTVFHKDNETFTNIWTICSDDFRLFYCNYLDDIKKYGNVKNYSAKENKPKNTFPVSCIPWISFTGFNLNIYADGTYLLPIITYGKYFEQDGKILLPVSLQVHHAVCDGYHTSRFFNELQILSQNCDEWLLSN
ncbi:MAG: type A chloramphenicol O-acetyltransferase [Anaeromicrobium sp.]|jgi:chloramphenicol O-acetyltransferase type A|uniref:type A chloramphenicol O-acetyltransferase n=1 Tax=Anaeromicrobium sp. TaxID=1929132 RepID=UPI0025F3A9BC|nr:type A chloramphenicol O-acetyltransferase [Anaeromicrobium sp.]MCT4593073.1 type A chloramphenicol O-acetyltransferase [Anaeromicrobium sp.]